MHAVGNALATDYHAPHSTLAAGDLSGEPEDGTRWITGLMGEISEVVGGGVPRIPPGARASAQRWRHGVLVVQKSRLAIAFIHLYTSNPPLDSSFPSLPSWRPWRKVSAGPTLLLVRTRGHNRCSRTHVTNPLRCHDEHVRGYDPRTAPRGAQDPDGRQP